MTTPNENPSATSLPGCPWRRESHGWAGPYVGALVDELDTHFVETVVDLNGR